MLRYLVKRVTELITTVLLASTVVFALIHASGDPTYGFMQPGASDDTRQALRDQLGLNAPLSEQLVRFLWRSLTLNFGQSWRNKQPALDAVLHRMPATLELAATALALGTIIGVTTGVIAGMRGRGVALAAVRTFPLVGQAVPTFWLGAMVMLLFAVRLGWLPSSGRQSALSLVMPAFTLAVHPAAIIARVLSTTMVDLRSQDFARTAVAKGLSSRAVAFRHIAPNALLPILALMGLQAGHMIGGTVIIESLFAWPGVGLLTLQSATQRDLPVIHAFVVLTTIGIFLINISVDVASTVVDPRLRQTRGALAHG